MAAGSGKSCKRLGYDYPHRDRKKADRFERRLRDYRNGTLYLEEIDAMIVADIESYLEQERLMKQV